MCLIRVKPEIDSDTEREHSLPPRIVTERRSSRAQHGTASRNSVRGSVRESRRGSRNSIHSTREAREVRGSRESRGSFIETVQIPPPSVVLGGGGMGMGAGRTVVRETQIVQARPPPATTTTQIVKHDGRSRSRSRSRQHQQREDVSVSEYRGSHASVVSSRSRDGGRERERGYYVDQNRSPRNSYRALTADEAHRGSVGGGLGGLGAGGGERIGYNNFHGRRSGSVNYVNPRHSHMSVRSTGGAGRMSREKVVVVEKEGGYY
ncbi:hypothetical protein BZA05DRAFT_400431 [Tricharina praecox]|uniref:uncharacterized protein n=1 Tax=Tricharina praecox TaxID=43433 RepID=UPI00221FA41C|nr:uncharacterized protein BZA05DRAFT_400431 [Tricharina praecox]KAI5849966.1 hypothetical protein BZA05DRAFT_400431 [Tricharina praecox]